MTTRGAPRPRLDPALLWAIGVYLVTFPVALTLLVMVGWVGAVLGVDLGSGSEADRFLNGAFVVLVLAMFAWAFAAGWVARRRGYRAGAVVSVVSALTAGLFLVLPALLTR